MVDRVSQLNGLFGERYRFLAELGRGAICAVYSGEDLKFHRPVAVKALWAKEAGRKATGQFLREIEIAARLNHPNILPVFDSGEREGVAFFVMPLVEDGSLRDRLEREGTLPVPDAVRITSEVLEGLHCAHTHGVVHLDVKPANVLLSQDHALLADFGVARIATQRDSGWRAKGSPAVGSAHYMCPEHTSRLRAHDPRSDLYSVGCMLYEMLSGDPPFLGPTRAAIHVKHQCEMPYPLTARKAVTEELDQVVRTALQKEAADRFKDARTFLGALQAAAQIPSTGRKEVPQEPDVHPIKVWIVEDSADTRTEVQNLIQGETGMECPLTFDSGEACLEALDRHWAPDVVIMDIGLPGITGIETTSRLKRSWPGTEVVMFTVHEDFDRIFRAFQAGAISYLDKTAADQEILRAIREAQKRGSVLTPPIARRFLTLFQQAQRAFSAYQLAPEDTELLSGLVEGRSMEEIGGHLGLSPDDLEGRLALVHAKLHANREIPLK